MKSKYTDAKTSTTCMVEIGKVVYVLQLKHHIYLIFTGSSGHQHGYKDEWLNEEVFSYTGEGQIGDMQFTKGNLALRDHLVTKFSKWTELT